MQFDYRAVMSRGLLRRQKEYNDTLNQTKSKITTNQKQMEKAYENNEPLTEHIRILQQRHDLLTKYNNELFGLIVTLKTMNEEFGATTQ